MYDEQTIEKAIRNAWIAGLISSTLTLIFTLTILEGSILGFVDVFIGFGLTFGIYKKSRVAATVMLIYFSLSRINIWLAVGWTPGIPAGIVFIYIFYKGVVGTFNYYDFVSIEQTKLSRRKIGIAISGFILIVVILVVSLNIYGMATTYMARRGVLLGPQNKWLVSMHGSNQLSLFVWEVDTGELQQRIRLDIDQGSIINSSPDGRFLALYDKQTEEVLFLETNNWELHHRLKNIDKNMKEELLWSSDGQFVAYSYPEPTAPLADTLRVFNIPDKSKVAELKGELDKHAVFAWAPHEAWLAIEDTDGSIQILDVPHQTIIHEIKVEPIDSFNYLVWSPDGQRIATGYDTVDIFDISQGDKDNTFPIPDATLRNLTWSPNGNYIAASGRNADLSYSFWIWKENGELLKTINSFSLIHSMVWSPDGHRLAYKRSSSKSIWSADHDEPQEIEIDIDWYKSSDDMLTITEIDFITGIKLGLIDRGILSAN